MDNLRGFEEDHDRIDEDDAVGAPPEPARHVVSNDERRMHVRAYNYWVSLLDGRPYPSITNLDPGNIVDFGSHSVLLDFTASIEDPAIAFLGQALRDECGLDSVVSHIADVPGRSLLSRLTDHYLQIIANRAPVGFEAEFVNARGHTAMYRGILMPFSSDGEDIDFIYGVINWKELVDSRSQSVLELEVDAALAVAPAPVQPAPAWADGPGVEPVAASALDDASLSGRLETARAIAAEATAADGRSRASLYEALGRAHDFAIAAVADPESYEALLAAADITVQARAPMTAIAKLVFGVETDKARLTEFAAVLSHAERIAVPADALAQYLSAIDGGMKAVVAAERAARRGPKAAPAADPIIAVDARPALATVHVPVNTPAGYVLLLGRIAGDAVEIVADVTEAAPLARALRRAA